MTRRPKYKRYRKRKGVRVCCLNDWHEYYGINLQLHRVAGRLHFTPWINDFNDLEQRIWFLQTLPAFDKFRRAV
jgi:hypothetical protein